ncbi:MAG: hypothetical protein NTX22_02560 [Ignavibacteriales bacterium]|nr:hypothetical protein [Ignavibacteriales bacterium]
MNKKRWIYFLLFIVFLCSASLSVAKEKEGDKDKRLYKTNSNDYSNFITINQIFMWCENNGDGSHDPRTDGQGFYWPGGESATLGVVFEDGLVWAGKIGREVRMNGNTHRQGLQAGKILENGQADDVSKEKYRVYKIRKTWESFPPGDLRNQYQKDLEEWPVEDGAPWEDKNGNGKYDVGEAQFVGDEVLWYVANDLDPTRSTFTYGSQPIGLEQQCTIFGFQRTGDLGDILFKKYKMINKGQNTMSNMYFGMWTDTDLGDGNDDYTGCDTLLSLGYTYNATNNDATFGAAPPSMGYDFFQGPIVPGEPLDSAKFDGKWRKSFKNLPMTGFIAYINGSALLPDPSQGQYKGTLEFYNYLQGIIWNGTPFIDPITNKVTTKILYGDPVAGTGWYEGPKGWPGGSFAPGDRRHLMCSGPFTMAPGDTQEIVVGLVIARGSSNLNSVTELKRKDLAAQIAYDLDFKLTDAPPQPVLHGLPQDAAISLWWEPNAESYKAKDPLLPDQIRFNVNEKEILIDVTNKDYVFEGYRVWQYEDMAGSNPKLLAIYDIKNGIKDIYNYQYDYLLVNGQINPKILIQAPNDGIRRFINLSTNAYTNGPFYNGNPYYFGVTAYGVSKYSDPPYLECTPSIMEVRPSTRKADYNTPYDDGQSVIANHTAGHGDGKITFRIVDPQSLTGDNYKVVIKGQEGDTLNALRYDLINVTKGDTLLKNKTDFITGYVSSQDSLVRGIRTLADTINKPVIQGFQLYVQNVGKDAISGVPTRYRIKEVNEIKGPGGTILQQPVPVLNELNSTRKWMIKPKGTLKRLIWQDKKENEGLGYLDYEIRFGTPSMFFVAGYKPSFNPALADDSVGTGTVPFEIWNIGRDPNSTADDTLLTIKILDYDKGDSTRAVKDRIWTKLSLGANDGDWEEIYALMTSWDPHNLPIKSGKSKPTDHRFGALSFSGDVPEQGTVIRITSYKPLTNEDVYEATLVAPKFNDLNLAKTQLDKITVFPNPYFGANSLERDKYQRIVRFTNLPKDVTVRIFSLAGIFIRKLEKGDNSPWMDWDLRNADGLPISSGMYIAYLDMPGVGTKILKIAVISETQYIDRL